MSEIKRDALKEPWACLSCNAKMLAGDLRSGGNRPRLSCPFCASENIHPIDRDPVSVPEYFGEIGTKQ